MLNEQRLEQRIATIVDSDYRRVASTEPNVEPGTIVRWSYNSFDKEEKIGVVLKVLYTTNPSHWMVFVDAAKYPLEPDRVRVPNT